MHWVLVSYSRPAFNMFTVHSDRYLLLDRRSLSIFNPIKRDVRLLITGRYKSLERNKRFCSSCEDSKSASHTELTRERAAGCLFCSYWIFFQSRLVNKYAVRLLLLIIFQLCRKIYNKSSVSFQADRDYKSGNTRCFI